MFKLNFAHAWSFGEFWILLSFLSSHLVAAVTFYDQHT